ncbi:endoplasmic reticulum aminopeptidase 2-like isoform X2 [Polypterus senegalus]|uniref:endoplasmic reticulum aminopeptidase 2-like isoform X2 n=1 Tax=Polypterus senegalus TaxID=55291 RepID=UPI001963DB61|nr:endoplasmic reticulum aminopeptidase 2-like isoform X2 [Polypterus senegalus]
MSSNIWVFVFIILSMVLKFHYGVPCESKQGKFKVGNNDSFPWISMRLPDKVVPLHYDILIHPNLTSLKFSGMVVIEVLIKHDTDFIVLHSKGLEITFASILLEADWKTDNEEMNLNVLEHKAHEQIAIMANETLLTNQKYRLHIRFQASLADGFDGFYKSTYLTSVGEERVLATTDFEPTAARMAFPCFDEPSFKATFSIKIRRERQHITLSNMPKIQTLELSDGLVEDYFNVTKKMSTYLVAYIVCDFRSVSANTSSDIKVSVYAVPEKWNQTQYALEVAVKILEFFENYFNISYPLPKLDLIAIPDFQSGAMENWGLITYRETSLLYDAQTSSLSDKQWVTKVIAHELAHQWFGNLVTMDWWNDLWLNEGFARYMELVSINSIFPDLQIDEYFLSVCFGAISRDSLKSSHPISNAAETPTQIMEMFDSVSYDKGACLLNMLKDFLTEEVFWEGVTRYLKKYSYRNAKSDDLLNILSLTCPEEDFILGHSCYTSTQHRYFKEPPHLKETMDSWILQMGVPLIVVENNGNQIIVHQERFLKGIFQDDPEWEEIQSGYLWHVPLAYITSDSDNIGRHLLKTKSDIIQLEKEVKWIKFNPNMNGYYLVHYEGNGWETLVQLLNQNHTVLSNKDRTNLIHNIFQLVSVGKVSLHHGLDLLLYLKNETDNLPLLQGIGYLEVLYQMMERRGISDVANNLKKFILQHFGDFIERQTWSDEGSISEKKLRTELLRLACQLHNKQCIEKAKQLFDNWMASNSSSSIPTDVLRTVYIIGAQSPDGWNYLLEKYRLSLSSSEKNKILSGLTRTRDTDKLTELLELCMKGDVIKTQDLASVVATISINPDGQYLAWEFVKNNWNKLLEKFDVGSFSIRGILYGTTAHFSSNKDLEDVKMFFKFLKEQGQELTVADVAVEMIQKNIKWLERNLQVLRKWLENVLSNEAS